METVRDFLAMGGYAGYIWPAYGFAVVVLAALIWTSLRDLRRLESEVGALDAARPRRRRDAGSQEGTGDA